jgi:aldehyde dehydrogenase (NAD+)
MNTDFLKQLGLAGHNPGTSTGRKSSGVGAAFESYTPVNGALIGSVTQTTREEYEQVILTAEAAFKVWREMPAPKRGEIVRQYGDLLRGVQRPAGPSWSLMKWAKASRKAGAKCRR